MSDSPIPSPTPKKKMFHPEHFIICLVLTVGEFGLLYSILNTTIPEANQRIADMMFGAYTTSWGVSVGYWYQTTFGSNNKTDLLAKAEPVKE